MKRRFATALILVLTLVLCLPAPIVMALELTDDPVTITLWTGPDWAGVWEANSGEYGDFYRYAAEEFTKLHPNVTVDIEVVPGAEREEKFTVAIQSQTLPDIYIDADFTLYDYAHAGLLYPVNPIITDEDREDIPTALWDMATTNGNTYIFPFFSETGHLAINLTLCEQYGIDPADYIAQYGEPDEIGRWTPDEFKALLSALKEVLPEGVYPYGYFCGSSMGDTYNRLFMNMFGGTNFDPETKLCLNNSTECVEALQFLVDCNNEGLFAPGAETLTVLDVYQMFQNQQLAVSIFNNVNYDQWAIEKPFELKMMYLPNVGEPTCYAYDKGSAVFDVGDEQRTAWALEFVSFYSHEPYVQASKAMLPLRKSVAATLDDPMKTNIIISGEYAGDFWHQVPGYVQCRSVFYPELQAALTGLKSPQEAMDDLVESSNEIIKDQMEFSQLF